MQRQTCADLFQLLSERMRACTKHRNTEPYVHLRKSVIPLEIFTEPVHRPFQC